MPFGFNPLTAILNYFGTRKVLTSSDSTHLHNIFAPRNSRRVARSPSARLHAVKSAARLQKHRSTTHGAKQRGAKYRGTKTRPLTRGKPLRRYDTVLVAQPSAHPQPPGAFIVEPSFIVPIFPGHKNRELPPLVAQKSFFDALNEGREAILRAEEEQRQRDEEAQYAHLLEQELKKAQAAEDAEFARLLEVDRRKAEEARRKAEDEEYARSLEGDLRKYQEAHSRALEQEERRRQAERESTEKELRELERRENERLEREAAERDLVARLCLYEDSWAVLRGNVNEVGHLSFDDIPWPSLETVRCVDDITEERVLAFVCHPLREHVQCAGGGQARSLRSEMLRWHPDKFEGKVLDTVANDHREAVREAAGLVARILTTFSAKMR